MTDSIDRLLTVVAVSVPLISLIASLMTTSTLCTWVLWLHAGSCILGGGEIKSYSGGAKGGEI